MLGDDGGVAGWNVEEESGKGSVVFLGLREGGKGKPEIGREN